MTNLKSFAEIMDDPSFKDHDEVSHTINRDYWQSAPEWINPGDEQKLANATLLDTVDSLTAAKLLRILEA